MAASVKLSVVLALVWIGVTGAAMLAFLADWIPWSREFLRPEDMMTWVHLVELVFVLFVWPFFLVRMIRTHQQELMQLPSGRASSSVGMILALMGLMASLVILALPLALIGMNIAQTPLVTFLKGQILILFWAAAVAAILLWGDSHRTVVKPWYFWTMLMLSAAPPMLYYLIHDFYQKSADVLIALSPFWGMARLESGSVFAEVWLFQSLLLLLLSVMFVLTSRRPGLVKMPAA